MWKAHVYIITLLLRSSEKGFLRRVALDLGVEQWFSTRGYFAPRGHLAVSGDTFDWHTWDGGVPMVLASRATGLSVPGDTAAHPTVLGTTPLQQGIVWPQRSVVLRLRIQRMRNV